MMSDMANATQLDDIAEMPTEVPSKASANGNGTNSKTPKKDKPSEKVKAKKPTKKKKLANDANKRRPGRKPYPVMTFEDVLVIGRGIVQHGASQPIMRTTLLTKLNLANNQATKNLITSSSKYGVTEGGHDAEQLKLTTVGKLAADDGTPLKQRVQARFDLSIKGVELFNRLYEKYKGGKMPAHEVMRDTLIELNAADRPQCVDLFIANAKFGGLLKTKEGAEHLLTIEQLLADLSVGTPGVAIATGDVVDTETPAEGAEDFDKVCFFIAPIGSEDSEHRKHSDAILASFITPAVDEQKLKVVRADKIAKPGMISAHIIEYILKSKLVVADLSFHNPNVFYELCLRHVTGKPTLHLIRDEDSIPFDVNNFNTIKIEMGSVYNVLAKLDTNRALIAQQVRQVLADGVSRNNPILAFCPNAKLVTE